MIDIGYYILVGKKPVHVTDGMQWARWLETADRTVARTLIGKFEVSTVFLALNHSFGGGRPMLFETMVFKYPRPKFKMTMNAKDHEHKYDDIVERYSTWEGAEKGHRKIVIQIMKEAK